MSQNTPVSSSATGWSPRTWGTLVVLCAALFLDALDISMVGVALPSIRSDLHLSTAQLQWVVSGYVLGYGGLLLLGGRAADLLGRRRVFLVALGIFAAASLFGGLVDSGGLLIASRFLKGISAAFTAPAGLSIITTTFPEGHSRNRALSIYSATGASGFSLGLVLSGLLTEIGWRWTFLMPAPLALIALAAGARLIKREPSLHLGKRRYDLGGAVTGTGAMLLLVYSVTEAPQIGWATARTVLSLVAVAALATAFLIIEKHTSHPLVRLGIFRNGNVSRANLAALAFFGSYTAFQFVLTLYLQTLLEWSALQTALALMPSGLIVALLTFRTGAAIDRYGTTRLIVIGFAAMVVAYALFLRIGPHGAYVAVILPTVALIGLGAGLAFPSLNIAATNGVHDEEQGLASGLVNTSLQIGGAIGLAIVTAVVTAGSHGGVTTQDQLNGYHPALLVIMAIAAAGLGVGLITTVAERREARKLSSAPGEAQLLPVGTD
ncbi:MULTISPECIES: MFS transporter [Streptomyces]|uniref:MFS transporter n=1 Tax=Streptomyces TaxID=1883 RepID=UPI0033B43438